MVQTQFVNTPVKLGADAGLSQAMCASSDGGYFAASRRNGSVSVANGASGGTATLEFGTTDGALLTKHNAEGKELWGVGFMGNVSIQQIAATPDGGAIVGGVYVGPFSHISAAGEKKVSEDASADIVRLFIAEVKVDGTLGTVMLPKHEMEAFPLVAFPRVTALEYNAPKGELHVAFLMNTPLKLGSPEVTYEVPFEDTWAYRTSNLTVSIEWSSQKVLSSFQIHENPARFGTLFGASRVSSLLAVSDLNGGQYVGRTFFGAVDEIDNLTATPNTVEHAKDLTTTDEANLLIIERRGADGKNVWNDPLKVIVSHCEDAQQNYRSDATINFIFPIGDGARFVAVGYFDAPLLFSNGTRLEPAKEQFGTEEGYSTDVFIIIGDRETGNIIAKEKLGLSLAGYISKVSSVSKYPLSALLDGEQLILGLPLQGSLKVGDITHTSKDGDTERRDLYNSLLLQLSLSEGGGVTVESAMSLTHEGKVRIDGLAMVKKELYRYVGCVESSDKAAVEENTKLYLNGAPIEDGIASAKEASVSIAGEFALGAQLRVELIHPEALTLKLQKNGKPEFTYTEGAQLPSFKKGDKLKVTAELNPATAAEFALLDVTVNGEPLPAGEEFTFDGTTNLITVVAGAYKVVKPILVTITPAGSATVKLKVAGEEKVFVGDKAKDPEVLLKNGEGAFELLSVAPANGDYMIESITVQLEPVKEADLPYSYAKLPEDDADDFVRINVITKKVPVYTVEVKVLPDITNGKVTITPEGGSPVVFDGDPAKHPALQARHGQKLTIKAEAAGGYSFESLKVGGATLENGAVYAVPESISGEKLTVEATFSKASSVESKALTTVALRSNPASDAFVLEGTWHGDLHYALYSVDGVLLRSGRATQTGMLRLEAAGLPAGVYFLRVQDASGAAVTLKAVKPY